ncbi:hypothetical protein AAY473_020691 [Plecturocebus cupreus]
MNGRLGVLLTQLLKNEMPKEQNVSMAAMAAKPFIAKRHFGRLRWEDHLSQEFKTSLTNMEKPRLY